MSLEKMIVYEWTTTDALKQLDVLKSPKLDLQHYLSEAVSLPTVERNYFPEEQKDAQYGTYW